MFCPHLNLSQCFASSDSDRFAVTAYNPVAWHLPSSWTRLVFHGGTPLGGVHGLLQELLGPANDLPLYVQRVATPKANSGVAALWSFCCTTLLNTPCHMGLSWTRLPVVAPAGTSFEVVDADGSDVAWQLNEISQATGNLPGRKSDATHELVFR
jgi:hypothetical protein